MTALNGKWSLVSSDKFDDYIKATGADDATRAKVGELLGKAGSDGLIEEYIIEAGKSARRNFYLGGKLFKESPTVPIGSEVSGPAMDGRTVKVTVTEEGANKLRRHEAFETGQITDTVLEVHGDEMTTTLTCGSVVSTRKYKRA